MENDSHKVRQYYGVSPDSPALPLGLSHPDIFLTREPTLQDFGVTPEQYASYGKKSRSVSLPVAYLIDRYELAKATYLRSQSEARLKEEQARRKAKRRHLSAQRTRQRKQADYWQSMTGVQFERELGALYKRRGNQVEYTPSSGDEGIDLILKKNGKTAIVQCKRFKNPAGPATVRELYGTLIASDAHHAILACTGGFTRGVYDFARGKPITLLDMSDIIKMSEGIDEQS